MKRTTKAYLLSGLRPMPPRDENEVHRSATPLELFFDLVSVIAIAAAAAGLHHAIAEAHTLQGLIKFILSMFAIWWAWMNYTWFASAYDNDDTLFRVLTMVIMLGSLIMAAGIEPFFVSSDLSFIVIGFVIMRAGMVLLWVRATLHHPELKSTTLSYAFGITLLQIYWVGLLISQPLPEGLLSSLFVLGACLEMALPVLAQKRGRISWHRHHMIERYGLLNIIVLGETLLAGSFAMRNITLTELNFEMIRIVISSMIILLSLWWLYFSKEEHIKNKSLSTVFVWGYGHLIIYSAGAAVGAGFAVLVDVASHKSQIAYIPALFSISIPVSMYMLGLWFVRDRYIFDGLAKWILPIFAIVISLTALTSQLECLAIVSVICVILRNQQACQSLNCIEVKGVSS